jgi:hypothetical protein
VAAHKAPEEDRAPRDSPPAAVGDRGEPVGIDAPEATLDVARVRWRG